MRSTFQTAAALTLAAALIAPLHAQSAIAASPTGPATPAAPMVTPAPAKTLVDAAVAAAKINHKNVLAEFGASWCGWCHRFEAFLDEPVVGKYMRDNFEIVHLVVLESADKKALENPGSDAMFKEMGGGGGIPFFFFLDENGRKIGDANIVPPNNGLVGHPDTPPEVEAFDKLLLTVAPKLTASQRTEIHDYLTRTSAERRVKAAEAMEKAKADAAAKAKAKAAAGGGGGGN